jgi:bifunctional non-homologous end joining protein LigD
MSKRELATREHHPAQHLRATASKVKATKQHKALIIPLNEDNIELEVDGRLVRLTNLGKLFWPRLGLTKRDLLQYYADVARVLLPHLANRAMVMKRYPNGAVGEFFFMKRIPQPHPDWIETCSIEHSSGNIIDFPIVQDLPSLLWTINLGCIDLNQWYAPCDDVDRPDYVHFDLDPVPGATFEKVVEASLLVRTALESLKMRCYAKTTGSRGIHVYVPIVRGPTQKQVWGFAKEFANTVAAHAPKLLTAIYQIAKRPKGRVLVDYNQNAWGRTLASVYSVRPKPSATVSTPVTWTELERGIEMDDFRIDNVPKRVQRLGDLWQPLLIKRGRFRLEVYL